MKYNNKKDKIALLIPTRNRPGSIRSILEEYEIWGNGYADIIIGVDEDDEYLHTYHTLAQEFKIKMDVGPRKRLGPTLNDMAIKYAPKYFALGFIGDDMRPRTDGWDGTVLAALHTLQTGFVHGDDGAWGEELATQVFVTSDIIEQLGYMVPPGMIHMYLDNFWSEFARAINRFTYLPSVFIEHLHPAWGKAEQDALYAETNNDERMNADRVLYENYKKNYQARDVELVVNYLNATKNLQQVWQSENT
jgi:hypothetical protein